MILLTLLYIQYYKTEKYVCLNTLVLETTSQISEIVTLFDISVIDKGSRQQKREKTIKLFLVPRK